MKQFFYVTFGGMITVAAGIGLAYGGGMGWKALSPSLSNMHFPSLAAVAERFDVSRKTDDGTTSDGLTRTVRFSAMQEEDVLSAAAQSLPSGADKKVTASSYLVKNLNNDYISAQFNADKLLPIASLTKLITAVVASKLIDPDEKISISDEVIATYGNTAGFKKGETLRSADMMYPLLMVSSNDAAEALARERGRTSFISEMNDFVQSIGAYRTSFEDPSGLSPNNVSTANDMAIIIDWIRKNNPNIIAITQLRSKSVRGHTWNNPTHFLYWSNYLGGKNGYTTEADRTTASLFSVGKAKDIYSVVILGSDSRDADVLKLLKKIK